MFGLIMIMQNC